MWLALGAFVSSNVPCSDETVCSDHTTCCQTEQGYSCCGYPNVSAHSNLKCCTLFLFCFYPVFPGILQAVCCPDLSHCCPRGFRCDSVSQQCEKVTTSWMDSPFLLKKAGGGPPVIPLQSLLYSNIIEEVRPAGTSEISQVKKSRWVYKDSLLK